ncbi:MAG: acetyl-CoA carboxylase carboxyl transferase subunit beta [Planctomycetota bacterium]|nr:MAG: acetyl-CoA carboxylase carboxyl transferase subunit beta [Planctomycetota bacterium]
MAWDNFKKITFRKKKGISDGLWIKCNGCGNMVYKKRVEEKLHVCPECNYHFPISYENRIQFLLDENSFEERFRNLEPTDPLGFKGLKSYSERLAKAQKATGLRDAAVVGSGRIKGHDIMFAMTDSRFMMGSMGSVVGEKITRITEAAHEAGMPLVIVCGSGGGARMDEGMISLMQMAKTSAAMGRYKEAGGLFISVLTNPSMGGAMASFASLGDFILAEPKSLIGLAGPRVWQSTVQNQKIPEGFQTSEFMLEHGLIDMIVNRSEMRDVISQIIQFCPPRIKAQAPEPALAAV